jgi:protein-tyrosine phosphatase
MAEGFLAQGLVKSKSSKKAQGQSVDSKVHSAGLHALVGQPAHEYSQELMLQEGIDISKHVARQVRTDIVHAADLILVMTPDQKTELITQFPESTGKVFLLGHWSGVSIEDPYLHGKKAFEKAMLQIKSTVNDWLLRI